MASVIAYTERGVNEPNVSGMQTNLSSSAFQWGRPAYVQPVLPEAFGPNPTPTATPTVTPTIVVPTATLPPSPTATQSPVVPAHVAAPQTQIQEEFIAGWYAGGGNDAGLIHALRIIYCESKWDLYAYNAAGPYTGLGQWDSTWWSYGGGDIYSAWQQGHNMAYRVRVDGGFGAWGCY